MTYFEPIAPIHYEGTDSKNPLAFHHYEAKRQILGKCIVDHLRLAACYWHNFVWPGSDMFGAGTFARPWHKLADPLQAARLKADAAFDFFSRLGAPHIVFAMLCRILGI